MSSRSEKKPHPCDPLTAEEIRCAAAVIRHEFEQEQIRFCYISLRESLQSDSAHRRRVAEVVVLIPSTGIAHEVQVEVPHGNIVSGCELPKCAQPCLSPDDCALAERIVVEDADFAAIAADRYGITDVSDIVCDPWSVHVAAAEYAPLLWRDDNAPARLVQTFLYRRVGVNDNHYAHPLDVVPVVDLNARKIVCIDGVHNPPSAILTDGVNYHRDKLSCNSYLQTGFRKDALKPLQILQPQGPSFRVDGNVVSWQKWKLHVGFNYREGLVLSHVTYSGRSVLTRASIVEMAVPYGDPDEVFARKCAFDVGDYGLGFCSNSLELGCDCLGHIHYFDAVLSNSDGEPYVVKKAVCMHEEDDGILWKHVEYRTAYSEARRSRRLVLSFIATVVNYEYLLYWYFSQDGGVDLQVKLSGELSTNVPSKVEAGPEYGVLVAPGVNSQIHQHMFCARLVMSVDGLRNSVCEVNVEREPLGARNPYGNAFKAVESDLRTESEAQRKAAPGRFWRVYNLHSINKISGKPIAYRLIPSTRGGAQPLLLPQDESAVSRRGKFACNALWVTPLRDDERYPAGDHPTQSAGGDGLPKWTAKNRDVYDEQIVLWHSFGVTHVPRVEDFPVMSCETTGFSLRPDGFFLGNDGIDISPFVDDRSTCCETR